VRAGRVVTLERKKWQERGKAVAAETVSNASQTMKQQQRRRK